MSCHFDEDTLPHFLSGLSPKARILSRGNPLGSGARLIGWRPVLTKSPLRRRVSAGFEKVVVVVPSTSLLHPGREAAVGQRLLIRLPLISQLASIFRDRATIRHPWTLWVAVTALPHYILLLHVHLPNRQQHTCIVVEGLGKLPVISRLFPDVFTGNNVLVWGNFPLFSHSFLTHFLYSIKNTDYDLLK